MKNQIGKWAFVIGVIIAVLVGMFSTIGQTTAAVLVILGVIIGLLNVTSKEASPFLLAGIALLIASGFGQSAVAVIPIASEVLMAIMILVVPAVIIVALKEVFAIAKSK